MNDTHSPTLCHLNSGVVNRKLKQKLEYSMLPGLLQFNYFWLRIATGTFIAGVVNNPPLYVMSNNTWLHY